MKRTTCKKIKQLAATALIAVTACSTAFAGTWQSDILGWHYLQDDGTYAANGWLNDNGTYYWMDANGNMQTGWVQDVDGNLYYMDTALTGVEGAMHTGWLKLNGSWYFFDTTAGGPLGSLKTGWQWIDGYCYYFDPLLGGAMAANTITADGCLIDADGRWMADDGTPYYEAGKGFSSTATVSASGSGVHVSSGGSGGGGGSSSGGSSSSGSSSGSGSSSSSSGGSSSGGSSSKYDIDEYYKTETADGVNDFTKGNWNMMSPAEQEAVEEVIEAFKSEYITSDMTDFEKEITIIQWICENCEYETASLWINSTAYSCLVNGVAQCAGYADGFLQMAKACGLSVRYVFNRTHAWNLIELDGDWYHVDLTFEDGPKCGFDHLANQYINLEDAKIRTDHDHYRWTPDTIKCNGIAYGPNTVAEYLESGIIDTSLGVSYTIEEQEFFDSFNDSDSYVFTYSSVDSAADGIFSFLSSQIEAGRSSGKILMHFPDEYTGSRTSDYSDTSSIIREIEDKIREKYDASGFGDLFKQDMYVSLTLEGSSDGHFYAYDTVWFRYKEEEEAVPVDYTIHYRDNGEVGVQSGTANNGEYVYLDIPDGYEVQYTFKTACNIRSGSFSYNGEWILIKGTDEIDIDVPVKEAADNTSAISTLSVMIDKFDDTTEEEAETEIKELAGEKAEEKVGEAIEEKAEEKAEEQTGSKKKTIEDDHEEETEKAAETEVPEDEDEEETEDEIMEYSKKETKAESRQILEESEEKIEEDFEEEEEIVE